MESRLLTDEERNRFATYCEQEAQSSKMMAEQLTKISRNDPMMQHLLLEVMAFSLVADKLRKTESMSIG